MDCNILERSNQCFPISDLELQILCNSLNGGDKDVHYTFSANMMLLGNLLKHASFHRKKDVHLEALLQTLVCFILIDQIYNKSLFSGFSFFFWHFIQNVDIQDSLGKT